ncbi:hypothetical protein BKG74_02325, partial [Mycobacteroides chelonae]|uniref:hypothetical protein n=1 Tax=Mycobacteroides chelonae TaxID=1774 RepID=UPI0008A8E5E4
MPPVHPGAAGLTEEEAQLLDAAEFQQDGASALSADLETAGRLGHLVATAYDVDAVAKGMGITSSRVRQKRLARELWAIADGNTWVFPAPQFESRESDRGRTSLRLIRGLDQVFKALHKDLHPMAVQGFLFTVQPELFSQRPMTPLEWLRSGGDVAAVVALAT